MTKNNDTQQRIADIQDKVAVKLDVMRSVISTLIEAHEPSESPFSRISPGNLVGCLHAIDEMARSVEELIDTELDKARAQAV